MIFWRLAPSMFPPRFIPTTFRYAYNPYPNPSSHKLIVTIRSYNHFLWILRTGRYRDDVEYSIKFFHTMLTIIFPVRTSSMRFKKTEVLIGILTEVLSNGNQFGCTLETSPPPYVRSNTQYWSGIIHHVCVSFQYSRQ